MRTTILILIVVLLLIHVQCNRGVSATTSPFTGSAAGGSVRPISTEESMRTASADGDLLDRLAEDTWAYLSSDWATANHLPWSWRSVASVNGDYANTAEIGLYALSWLAAHELQRAWSPTWAETEAEVTAVLDQLRAWQTGTQEEQPYGPNAFEESVFYQWYWISWTPPVVGENAGDNHVVPSIDNAWLAASLITIREYAGANGHAALAQKADDILSDMDFRLWYHPDTYRFTWGAVEDPQGGTEADYYSNENRIINFVARALGHLTAEEFGLSLGALAQFPGTYGEITVGKVAWDGSYFTYASPALFIREMDTIYGANTITPATEAQIAYALDYGYVVWGLSDCFDAGLGDYVQQGALPVAMEGSTETRPGLVGPHASALALITPLAPAAIANLRTISDTFPCAYDLDYGFLDSLMADPTDPDFGHCSARFSALAQEWIFLAIANHAIGFIWEYFYLDEGVAAAHHEMYREFPIYLPAIVKGGVSQEAAQPGTQDVRAAVEEIP